MLHKTITVIFCSCKMKSLFTFYTSEYDVVGIWQQYVVLTGKNRENTQKPHLFDKISEMNYELLTSLER